MVSSNCWPSSKHMFPATGYILLFCYPTTRHHRLLATPSGLWQIATGAHYINTQVSAAVHHLLACHQGPSSAVQHPPTYHPPSSSPHHPTFGKCWRTLHQHMGQCCCSPSARHWPPTVCSLAIIRHSPRCSTLPLLACLTCLPSTVASPTLTLTVIVALAAVGGQHRHLEVVAPPCLTTVSLPPHHTIHGSTLPLLACLARLPSTLASVTLALTVHCHPLPPLPLSGG